MNPYHDKDLRSFLTTISQKEIEQEQKQTELDYQEFVEKLKQEYCSLCGNRLNTFNTGFPCFHWFTMPAGLKKKHFEKYLKNPVSFFKLRAYFYWLANSEKLIGNINNLTSEVSKSSYFESTIKYKNLEWSFSIGYTDIEGHPDSYSNFPHYHIQLKRDGYVILKFNDFHIPFSDDDLFNFELEKQAGDLVEFDAGLGIGILENDELLPVIDNNLIISDDEESASINRQSIISMPEGKTFSGELILQAMEESKKTKEPIAKILARLIPNASQTTLLFPGPGVPEMAKRGGKK